MYTQCPDCSTAFKVTAEVLRQAAGKVRCGGCGNAFDALSYLSEAMPQQPQQADSEAALPELRPEAVDSNEGLPRSISAEQSAALLKTLDQLAGSDIRIEDTGVEWRVLDEADTPDALSEAVSIDDEIAEQQEPIDELLEDSPTPVDEFLTQTPEVVEAAEIFEEAAIPSVEELRFDDNTPLPEDFDFDDAPSSEADADLDVEAEEDAAIEIEEPQHDITLSEPEEWQDILGEFEDLADELQTTETEVDAADDPEQADFEQERPELDNADQVATNADDSGLLDVDTQFALQAEALGIEITGIHGDEDAAQTEGAAEAIVEELPEAMPEAMPEEFSEELPEELPEEPTGDPPLSLDDEIEDAAPVVALESVGRESDDSDIEVHVELPDELTADSGAEMTIADELAALEALGDTDSPDDAATATKAAVETDTDSEHIVAPLTEEEQTVNMQIDQDLMALAIEDEDGFASTIVIPPESTEDIAEEASKAKRNIALNETSDGFETIVMEGESVQSLMDDDQLGVDAAASSEIKKMIDAKEMESLPPPSRQRSRIIAGIVALSLLIVLQVLHQSREALATNPTINSAIGPIYRALGSPIRPKWDVTGWRFEATTDISQNSIIEQDSADADATATTEDAELDTAQAPDEPPRLTVYSIIGNKSDAPLPYPLIAISLTDRYDATIGNTLLAPGDYLPAEQDQDALVAAGNSFNAMINIEPLPDAATGFKLDVCYRLDDQQLRCAIEDFK